MEPHLTIDLVKESSVDGVLAMVRELATFDGCDGPSAELAAELRADVLPH